MKNILAIMVTLFFIGCAHHRDVRPGAEGIHRVSIQTDDKPAGAREAIAQANDYCKEQNKQAVFIEENSKYNGSMNEEDYKTVKTAAKVAKTAGGAVWAMGAEKESNIGGIVGLGGEVADQVAGEGYSVDMKFKCQ